MNLAQLTSLKPLTSNLSIFWLAYLAITAFSACGPSLEQESSQPQISIQAENTTTSLKMCSNIKLWDHHQHTVQLKVKKSFIHQSISEFELEYYSEEIENLFNPSILQIPGTKEYLMSFRVDCHSLSAHGEQTITLISRIDSKFQPTGKAQILRLPSFTPKDVYSIKAQDLRLFSWEDKIFALSNDTKSRRDHLFKSRKIHLYQIFGIQQHDFAPRAELQSRLELPEFEIQESVASKNWTPFSYTSHMKNLFSYFISPQNIVIKIPDQLQQRTIPKLHSSCNFDLSWDSNKYGNIRGGTPLIPLDKVSDLYLGFFHAVKAHPEQHKKATYTMGAYLVNEKSLCVQATSESPIPYARSNHDKPQATQILSDISVIFPGGVVKSRQQEKDYIVVAAGVNDRQSKLFWLNKESLLKSMTK